MSCMWIVGNAEVITAPELGAQASDRQRIQNKSGNTRIGYRVKICGEEPSTAININRSAALRTWSNLATQHAVQIECGADQCEMSEGLGEIAQRLPLRPGLLCIKSKMIRI